MDRDVHTFAGDVRSKSVSHVVAFENERRRITVCKRAGDQAVADAVRCFVSNCTSVVAASRFHPSFHPPPANQVTFGSATGEDTLALNAAIPRLLALRLIHCDFDSRQGLFAYHWTWLGRMLILQHWPNDIPEWIQKIDGESPAAEYEQRPD